MMNALKAGLLAWAIEISVAVIMFIALRYEENKVVKRRKNPYRPPKNEIRQDYDKWLETIKNRDETDWIGFCYVMLILLIVFFNPTCCHF